jgi:hypothetical protein
MSASFSENSIRMSMGPKRLIIPGVIGFVDEDGLRRHHGPKE